MSAIQPEMKRIKRRLYCDRKYEPSSQPRGVGAHAQSCSRKVLEAQGSKLQAEKQDSKEHCQGTAKSIQEEQKGCTNPVGSSSPNADHKYHGDKQSFKGDVEHKKVSCHEYDDENGL